MEMMQLLGELLTRKGSDLFVTVGAPPQIKVLGQLEPLATNSLSQAEVLTLMNEVMTTEQMRRFQQEREANFALSRDGLGRFRLSAFWQQEQPGMVLRRIEMKIPTFEELGVPSILREVVGSKRGLVLSVGATGAGKSTTQAALIGHRNQTQHGHIITIEDPIEFVHQHGLSLITQREVGSDTLDYESALTNSLRQAPDLILIGEIRSPKIMELAIQFSETGHLCLATLHANNANQAIERILHLMPPERHRQLLFDLSLNLRAIVAQQLLPSRDGLRRYAAFEVLLNSPRAMDLVAKGELSGLKELMEHSTEQGMQTFDQSLFALYREGKIHYQDALAHADSPNDLRLMIKLYEGAQGEGTMANVGIDPS